MLHGAVIIACPHCLTEVITHRGAATPTPGGLAYTDPLLDDRVHACGAEARGIEMDCS